MGVGALAQVVGFISDPFIHQPMAQVLIIMGSKSDLPVAEKAAAILKRFGIGYEAAVASAHRTPSRVESLVKGSGADVFIAIAGMAAALPGVVASFTAKPVIGVPVSGKMTLDAVLSIVQMPSGIPVATVGVNGGENAGLLALQILGVRYPEIAEKLSAYKLAMREKINADDKALQEML